MEYRRFLKEIANGWVMKSPGVPIRIASAAELRILVAAALVASQATVTTKDNGDGTYTHTFNFTKGT